MFLVVSYIDSTIHTPGVQIGHSLGVIYLYRTI